MAQSLVREPDDAEACARAFRRSLLGWFLRLPFGVGLATVRSSLRIALGLRRSGVRSAGNGAAMRAAVVGVFFAADERRRETFSRALAEVTHLDPRAVEGARWAAALAASCCQGGTPAECVERARPALEEPAVTAAVERARVLAAGGAEVAAAVAELGNTGFVVHTAGLATFCFLRSGHDPLAAVSGAIAAGGDTDTIAAIVGAWVGTLHGEAVLPAGLLGRIQDGPFGPTHLRELARALAGRRAGRSVAVPPYSATAALLRNLALYPVVLAHGFRRLVPC